MTVQHRDCVAEGLEVLVCGAAGEQPEPAQQLDRGQIPQSQQYSPRSWHDHMVAPEPKVTACVTSFGTAQVLCDGEGVTTSRVAAVVTCVMVAGLGVWFVLAWAQADRLAMVVSALAAVATVGTGVWAAVRERGSGGSIRVSGTGKATAGRDGGANSGVRGGTLGGRGWMRVKNTGNADASGGGDANTGIRWD